MTMILLNVKSAFNTASWRLIIEKMRRRGIKEQLIQIMCSYFSHRSLQMCPDDNRKINIGVPQGLVLGPTLSNMLYDGVLNLETPRGVKMLAYADDLAIVSEDDTEVGMVEKWKGFITGWKSTALCWPLRRQKS